MRRFALVFLASCAAPTAAPPPVCPAAPPPAATPAPPPPKAAEVKPEKLTPEEALRRVVTSKDVQGAWFAKVFLDKVPMHAVTGLVTQMDKDLGGFQKVDKDGAQYKVIYAHGVVPSRISLDEEGRIAGLWFGSPEDTKARPIADVLADLKKLPGKVSVLVTTGDKVEGSIEPDAELAVGSAFKLAILAAVKEKVDGKKLAWTDIVKLDKRHKSLLSGQLQDWPDGSPLTVHTLASLMISRSDNTATDALLDLAGRPAVEKHAPGNAPFLSTRDAFVMKSKGGAELLGKWRAGDEAARRKLLADLAKAPLPAVTDFADDKVTALDVEWRFSAKRLCELLGKTKDLPMLHINPGVAVRKDWDSIAFKGGSEPGVLNLSTWVEKGGKSHCVVATWNDADKPVDDAKMSALYGQLLSAVR